ncbi:MAG: hypothetical protein IPN22_04385 [Bacteroidetes bacterium]|nr:hypothetical protein [Bacteroidota bacterium]
MQFIQLLRLNEYYKKDDNWTEESNDIIESHLYYLKMLYEQGEIFYVGKTDLSVSDIHNTGVLILNSESLESATALANGDPAVQAGLMNFQIFPFHTVLPWKNENHSS